MIGGGVRESDLSGRVTHAIIGEEKLPARVIQVYCHS